MTSLLPSSARLVRGARTTRDETPPDHRPRHPLVLVSTAGGALAAVLTLAVCLLLTLVGWFLSDAGAHGEPRDALRVGGLAWLAGHGSGFSVRGSAVTLVPLGLTLLAAWTVWRVGHRVGEAVSGHGPDADRIADGERDWTVPVAVGTFASGYAVVTVLTGALAADSSTAPSTGRAVLWSLTLCLLVGGSALAAGSGRLAIWATYLSPMVRATASAARSLLLTYAAVALLLVLLGLALHAGEAATMFSRLQTDVGTGAALVVACLALLPNATVFAASYLLGPGFAVGTQTLVSPTLVVVGPLPLFPLVAALPDGGRPPGVMAAMLGVPFLVAVVSVLRTQRRLPTLRWDEGPLRGCAAGVAAGVVLGLAAALAGGAVGPGRMAQWGPAAGEVLLHAVTAFGLGGLVGGVLATAWQRRAAKAARA